ncbi:MAG: tetratricopeptide repeat protein [Deltaproteobacteria bacterium]|nr:tetratricopeptide repeat protein [Deltaproteobacteria bacterium]
MASLGSSRVGFGLEGVSTRHSIASRLADGALFALIVLTPALGGSSTLDVLPLLVPMATVALGATVIASRRSGQTMGWTPMVLGLTLFAVVTALQLVPLPAGLLAVFSPRAYEVRTLGLEPKASYPLTYEVSATAREAVKLAIYAVVAFVAHARARSRGTMRNVCVAVVVAGLFSVLIGGVHRLLGADQIFGIVRTRTPAAELWTSFANPNHAASLALLSFFAALGLAFRSRDRRLRAGYAIAACVSVGVVAISLSRGALLALVLSLCVFGVLLSRSVAVRAKHRLVSSPLVIAGVLLFAVVGAAVTLRYQSWTVALASTGAADLRAGAKFDAFKDVLPMVADHLIAGIGRGAYISAYPGYQSTTAQLTFAYPENLPVQFLTEWGLLFGTLGFVALVGLVGSRVLRANSFTSIATACALFAVLAHNAVDFSLELPGVAVPFVALAAAAEWDQRASVRVPSLFAASHVFVLPAIAVVCGVVALLSGDLDADLREASARDDSRPTLRQSELLAERHPANYFFSLVAADAALDEKEFLPQAAARWVNRAMFLGPSHAGTYLAAGRLLLRTGHRLQAFENFRQAWALSSPLERERWAEFVLAQAESPQEVMTAIPRSAEDPTHLSVRGFSSALHRLRAQRRQEIVGLVAQSVDAESFDPADLGNAARVLVAAGEVDRAEALLAQLGDLSADPQISGVRARVLLAKGDADGASALLERLSPADMDSDLLRLFVETLLKQGNVVRADLAVQEFTRSSPSSRQGLTLEAELRARIQLELGNYHQALAFLDRAIELAPDRLALRFDRAKLLRRTGRLTAARVDLEHLLKRRPKHARARRLLKEIDALTKASSSSPSVERDEDRRYRERPL